MRVRFGWCSSSRVWVESKSSEGFVSVSMRGKKFLSRSICVIAMMHFAVMSWWRMYLAERVISTLHVQHCPIFITSSSSFDEYLVKLGNRTRSSGWTTIYLQ